MRIGLGLPAVVPDVDATTIGDWAAASERAGFASVGVIDRLVYDNLEPLTALAAAAVRTKEIELLTTVLTVGWRANAVLLAKQMASVELLSGGRLTAGLGLGGWPDDFAASAIPDPRRGGRLDEALGTMRQVWDGELRGQGGPMRSLPEGRPSLLFGGFVPAAYTRAAREGQGWVAPLFGFQVLADGVREMRKAWVDAGRDGQPRIATGRYFSLGEDADSIADEYIHHYYGDEYFPAARADTLTSRERVAGELDRLSAAGVTDVVLYPCTAAMGQIRLLAEAVQPRGASTPLDIKRINPNIRSERFDESRDCDVIGLTSDEGLDWILFFSAPNDPKRQLSVMKLDVTAGVHPDVTIEVDDVDAVYARAVASGAEIVHSLTDEPWDVRRFFVRDPNGAVINVMQHK